MDRDLRSENDVRAAARKRVQDGAEQAGRRGVRTEAFVWEREERRQWWAFGPFGTYTVILPLRFGWPVGDYPWQGWVLERRETYASEVFIKPTYVDPQGRIAPVDAPPRMGADNPLLTAAMLDEIADHLHALTAPTDQNPAPDQDRGAEES